jgi:hypothetical protein
MSAERVTIFLPELLRLQNLSEYKVHFARWNEVVHPLEVFARDKKEWQQWQEYWPGRDDFNRPFIFSLIQFYHETDTWLFGGIFRVVTRHGDRYEVELTETGHALIGRLKLRSDYRSRTTRVILRSTSRVLKYRKFCVSRIPDALSLAMKTSTLRLTS